MDVHDKLQVSGHVEIYEIPPDCNYEQAKELIKNNPEKYLKKKGDNKIVTEGSSLIIDLLLGIVSTAITYVDVGTSTNAIDDADTGVISSISPRHAVTNAYRSGITANFDTFYTTSENNGEWEEASLHTAITSGSCLARKLTGGYTKTAANGALLAWVITVTAVA